MSRLLKWVAAPAFAAIVGYYGIGPHYAGDPKLRKLVQEGKEAVEAHAPLRHGQSTPGASNAPAVDSETPPAPDSRFGAEPASTKPADTPPTHDGDAPAPRVSVGVKPVDAGSTDDDAPKPRRRKRHRRRESTDVAPPETHTTPDRTEPDPASTPGQ